MNSLTDLLRFRPRDRRRTVPEGRIDHRGHAQRHFILEGPRGNLYADGQSLGRAADGNHGCRARPAR